MVDLKLFREVTGLTWDINKLIKAATTDADKTTLLKKLDWYIPEGAYLAGSAKRNKAVELVNVVAAELNVELSKVFVDVDGDKDVDAYDVIDTKQPTYTITFADWDGSVLATQKVMEGVTPSYSGETPVREGYTFIGWKPEIVAAVADAAYTAQYEAEPVEYTITFADWDGTVLETQTVDENETPSYGGETPVREGYTFTGWDPEIVAAVADATYTAQYEAETVETPTEEPVTEEPADNADPVAE